MAEVGPLFLNTVIMNVEMRLGKHNGTVCAFVNNNLDYFSQTLFPEIYPCAFTVYIHHR